MICRYLFFNWTVKNQKSKLLEQTFQIVKLLSQLENYEVEQN